MTDISINGLPLADISTPRVFDNTFRALPSGTVDSAFRAREKLLELDPNSTEVGKLMEKLRANVPDHLKHSLTPEKVFEEGVSWADMIVDTPMGEPIAGFYSSSKYVSMKQVEPSMNGSATPVMVRNKRAPTTPITPSLLFKNNQKKRLVHNSTSQSTPSTSYQSSNLRWCVDSVEYEPGPSIAAPESPSISRQRKPVRRQISYGGKSKPGLTNVPLLTSLSDGESEEEDDFENESIDTIKPNTSESNPTIVEELSPDYQKWILEVQLDDLRSLVEFMELERKFGAHS